MSRKKNTPLAACLFHFLLTSTLLPATDVANNAAAAAAMAIDLADPDTATPTITTGPTLTNSGADGASIFKKIEQLFAAPFNAYQGWTSAIGRKPVLEILYAWLGYDQWESYGAIYHIRTKYNAARARKDHIVTYDATVHPITNALSASNFSDVTARIKAALGRGIMDPETKARLPGALYLRRSAPAIIAPRSHSGTMHPENIAANSEMNAASRGVIPPPRILGGTDSLDDQRTLGIVYRDEDGIHFRRFEGWQNICLPAISSIKEAPFSLGQKEATSTNGAFFYNHQLEEVGRGLITATVTATNSFNFLALDRFGWGTTFHDSRTFCPGVYAPLDLAGNDFYYLGKWKGQKTWFDSPQSLNLFRLNWGPTGSTLDLKGSGFALFPENDKTARHRYRTSIPNYQYFNENEQLVSLKAPAKAGNADPSINAGQPSALLFPGTNGAEVNVWFAFDQDETGVLFTAGTGTPSSEEDFFNDAKSARILYQNNIATSPYIRYFGFSPDDGTVSVYNIKSCRLNRKKKFRTPPFCNGRFFFWQKEWEATTPDAFSVTFSACGTSIHVGLSSLTTQARLPANGPFNCSHDYAIRLNTQPTTNPSIPPIVIEKLAPGVATDSGEATPVTTQLPVKLISVLPEVIIGTYKDYWVTYNAGLIEVGLGKVPGNQIIAVAFDQDAPSGICTFCFSSEMRTTDYRDINCQPYYITQTVPTPGAYSTWSPAQQFKTKGAGACIFGYQLTGSGTEQAPDASGTATATADPKAAVMIGLNNGIPAGATVPYYQIKLGADNNTSHQIFSQSTLVQSLPASTSAGGTVLSLENGWHKAWFMYETGLIAYGTGDILGQNTLCLWQDPTVLATKPSPAKGIDSFSFTSPSTAMNFMLQSQPPLPSYSAYLAKPSAAPYWHPLWQWLTPDQGGITFSITGLANSTVQIGWLDATLPTTTPICECILNDQGKAYFRQNNAIDQSSLIKLAPALAPAATPKTYWLAWNKGFFVLGRGNNPLKQESVIMKWQNTKASPPISKITLAAQNSFVRYFGINLLDYAVCAPTLNALAPTAPSTATQSTSLPTDTSPKALTASTDAQTPAAVA